MPIERWSSGSSCYRPVIVESRKDVWRHSLKCIVIRTIVERELNISRLSWYVKSVLYSDCFTKFAANGRADVCLEEKKLEEAQIGWRNSVRVQQYNWQLTLQVLTEQNTNGKKPSCKYASRRNTEKMTRWNGCKQNIYIPISEYLLCSYLWIRISNFKKVLDQHKLPPNSSEAVPTIWNRFRREFLYNEKWS